VSSEALSGQNIVVTGGRGFLGRHVCAELERQGGVVQPVGRRDYNLTEQAEVRRMLKELAPSVVVHAAAAVGGIGANVANPGFFLYANAIMGLALLEECRLQGIERFVLISSTCAYPKDAPLPLREDDLWSGAPVGATGPYGMAKRLLHEACATYSQQYGFSSAVLILSNLYGPHDNFDGSTSHVIPALIKRYASAASGNNRPVINWGSGEATREFLHVSDAARAVALASTANVGVEPMNIGTGVETSIKDIAQYVQDAVGYTGPVEWDTSKPEGQPRRYLDVSRAKERLDFETNIPLKDGIVDTVGWYLKSINASSANPLEPSSN
jgi:GDP-L-fucose synthase